MSDFKARARLGTSRLVSLDLPPALSERLMNALKADPRTIDLRALAPHFYNLSQRILELFEEEEMVDVLTNVLFSSSFFFNPVLFSCFKSITDWRQTFRKRAAEISDHAHNPRGALGDGVEFLRGLDETERQCMSSWDLVICSLSIY